MNPRHDLPDFMLRDAVIEDMRLAGFRIQIETQIHAGDLAAAWAPAIFPKTAPRMTELAPG
jgi:hypothetical protein